MDTETKLANARTNLILNNPFFGYLALHLEPVEAKGMGTMGTDGKRLFYDPDFVKGLPYRELLAVICHEVLHAGLGHIWRCGQRDKFRWNVAADYAINLLITGEGFQLPKDCLLDDKFRDMSAEQVYPHIPEPISIKLWAEAWHDSHDKWGQGAGEAEEGGLDKGQLPEIWKERMAQAAQIARQQGKLPGGFESLIEDLLQPKLDWKTLLRNFVLSCARNHYRLIPPNKRHLWREMYLPSVHGESIEIAIAVDTSGSISDEELREFLSEIRGVCEQFESYTIHLFQCDAEVQDYQVIEPYSELPTKILGRGGTSFKPVFADIAERNLQISALIYFTDTYGSFPESEPLYPVLWVVVEDREVPFGQKVLMPRGNYDLDT